ncbi:uncharacterized protein [Argopecten irradians]|uniref:uncharacterized protein n=1 Tax=Argopecten irradians TaxID=31199 RepID=UPI00371622B9
MAAPSETLLERTLFSMEMTFKVIQSTHTKPTEPAFDMESAYSNLRRIRSGEACERLSVSSLETIRHHAYQDGVPADLLPQIDIVSLNLRKKIIQGVPESGTSSKHTSMSQPRVFTHNMELQQTVNKLWEAVTTKWTWDAYNTGFTSYKTFLSLNGINWVFSMPPVSEDLLMCFVAHCFQHLKIKAGTIELYLCDIRYMYLKAGIPKPLVSHEGQTHARLQTLVTGVKKLQGITRRARLPITFDILTRICQLLRKGVFSPFMDILMETACTVAFFGFLRCGEFCVSGSFDPTRHLCVEDFLNMIVFVKVFQLCYTLLKGVCPYLAVNQYMALRSTHVGQSNRLSPFFITDFGVPLTRNVFITSLRTVFSRLGLNDSVYCGHSFRIGAATSAASSHVEDHLIKTLGRWSSDCYQRYIHTSKSSIRLAQQSLTYGH